MCNFLGKALGLFLFHATCTVRQRIVNTEIDVRASLNSHSPRPEISTVVINSAFDNALIAATCCRGSTIILMQSSVSVSGVY